MSTDDSMNTAEATLRRQALEAQLAGLRPTAASLDRDRLMFEAGRAAASRSNWSRAVTLAAAAGLALVVGRWTAPMGRPGDWQHLPPVREQQASSYGDLAQTAEFRDPSSLLQLRLHLDDLDTGRRSWETNSAPSARPQQLIRELLN